MPAESDEDACRCMGHLEPAERDRLINSEGERPCNDVYLYSYHTASPGTLDENALDESAGFVANAVLGTYMWRRESGELELVPWPWLQGTYYLRPHPEVSEPLPATCPVNSTWLLANPDWVDWNLDRDEDAGPDQWDVNQHCDDRDPCTNCASQYDRLVTRFEPSLLEPKIYGGGLTIAWAESKNAFLSVGSPELNDPPPLATDGEYADGRDNDRDGRVDEGLPDSDNDGIADAVDNCPLLHNPDQFDTNRDHRGDACEVLPTAPNTLSVSVVQHVAILSWNESSTSNVVGYNLYRRLPQHTDFSRLGRSYPTTLAETSFSDTECSDGSIYTVSSVDLYMRESLLSEGVVLRDTDGDGVCDKIGTRMTDPYQVSGNGGEGFFTPLLILLALLIFALIVIFFAWALRH